MCTETHTYHVVHRPCTPQPDSNVDLVETQAVTEDCRRTCGNIGNTHTHSLSLSSVLAPKPFIPLPNVQLPIYKNITVSYNH